MYLYLPALRVIIEVPNHEILDKVILQIVAIWLDILAGHEIRDANLPTTMEAEHTRAFLLGSTDMRTIALRSQAIETASAEFKTVVSRYD